MIICLILLLPAASSDPPENNPGQIIVLQSVLLRVRFTWHSLLPENRWALTPPFHPYWHKPAVYLCCTIFGVTSVTSLQTLPSTGSPSTLIVLSAIIASFYIYQNPLIGLKSNEILACFIAVSAFTACSMTSFMEMSAA